MSLDDLARFIFESTSELVEMMEVDGVELVCTPLRFLYMWYLMFSNP
jgi:hypothetical protein